MQRYVLRRLGEGVVILCVLAVAIFVASRVTGDPTNLLLPADATIEAQQNLRHVLGLDQSYPVQFLRFLESLVTGNFGLSFRSSRPAIDLYLEALPNTLTLLGLAAIIALAVAIPLAVTAARNRGRFVDRACGFTAVAGISVPNFWLSIVLMEVFAVKLRWLPATGLGGLASYVLPAFALSFGMMAGYTRLIRSSMLEVLDSEFAKLARIKGVSEFKVVWWHCLRNSLIPAVSYAGVYFSVLIGGAIVVETIFAWPGVGQLTYKAVMGRDFPVIQTVVIMNGILIIMVNLIVDIMYGYLDPRVRRS